MSDDVIEEARRTVGAWGDFAPPGALKREVRLARALLAEHEAREAAERERDRLRAALEQEDADAYEQYKRDVERLGWGQW